MKSAVKEYHHPFVVRATHWINAAALAVMILSGLRIYNASPVFPFRIPEDLTLGGWLGGARLWHFAGMWLFVANGALYALYNVMSKHGRRTTLFRGEDVSGVVPMMLYYARIRKERPPQKKYNALQKLAYTVVPLLALASIVSGIALYWPVQCRWAASLFGGYDSARTWHFASMFALVAFIGGHLVMVAIAGWDNFISMITGWGRKSPPQE